MLKYIKNGLVTFYHIQPGNRVGLRLQPRSPHEADNQSTDRVCTVVVEMLSLAALVRMTEQAVEALFNSGINLILAVKHIFSRCLPQQLSIQHVDSEMK